MSTNITTLAACWKITRTDGSILALTEHDRNLIIDNVEYCAKGGTYSSAVKTHSDLTNDNAEIEAALDHSSITPHDIHTGLYNDADIEMFFVDYTNTSNIHCRKGGKIGSISMKGNCFVAEVVGLADALNIKILQKYSKKCRASFCDRRCSLVADDNTIFDLSITKITGPTSFISSDLAQFILTPNIKTNNIHKDNAIHLISHGFITLTSGTNAGEAIEIQSCNAAGEIFLLSSASTALSACDSFNITIGCDKEFQTCCNVFQNRLNFRGEPHMMSSSDSIAIRTV